MRLTKTLGLAAALILSALVGGTLIGSALATTDDEANAGAGTDRTAYCEVFLDTLASELGTTRGGLRDAGIAAADATLDAAVEAGDLTETQANAIRERIAGAADAGCGWIGHRFAHGFQRGIARGLLGGDVFEAAADALGIESADLIGALRDAGSLEALAEEQDVSYDEVTASIIAAVQEALDAAVEEGLAQEPADAVLERLTEWLDEGGPVRGSHPGFRIFGRGHGPFDAPWNGHGPWDDGEPRSDGGGENRATEESPEATDAGA